MRQRFETGLVVLNLVFFTTWSVNAEPPVMDHARRHSVAIQRAEANARVEDSVGLASRLVTLADAQLRAGKCEESISNFEQAMKLDPALRPYLWQYGIALFFVDRFAEGRDLFVEHRRVNPNDVENAAWHFLCEAKANGIDSARKLLLPAPGDRRAPMSQILDRLPGGDATSIESAVEEIKLPYEKRSARFYADLYLGLIADAEGDVIAVRQFMARAANSSLDHYMADVARVYAERINLAAQR